MSGKLVGVLMTAGASEILKRHRSAKIQAVGALTSMVQIMTLGMTCALRSVSSER
jgi:hypothetical protein